MIKNEWLVKLIAKINEIVGYLSQLPVELTEVINPTGLFATLDTEWLNRLLFFASNFQISYEHVRRNIYQLNKHHYSYSISQGYLATALKELEDKTKESVSVATLQSTLGTIIQLGKRKKKRVRKRPKKNRK